MIVHSRFKDYSVNFKPNFDFFIPYKQETGRLIVADRKVYELYRDTLFTDIPEKDLYLVEAVETNKVVQTALDICEAMTAIPAKRNAHLISVGGGIIQDITGFVANILYRGIRWTFLPTTLLAACDSCIGGKTSLNYKQYKNLLGTFYPPDEIFICTSMFRTLTEQDFKSGLGEVVKFNIMRGQSGLDALEADLDLLLVRDEVTLDHYVHNSLEFKKGYIEQDEFDQGVRIQLNFAHTFGHAFESISNYEIPHGTAVAIGTLVANRISVDRGILDKAQMERIEVILKRVITIQTSADLTDTDSMLQAMRKDKKQISTALTAVLLDRDYNLHIVHDVEKPEIERAVRAALDFLNEDKKWKKQ